MLSANENLGAEKRGEALQHCLARDNSALMKCGWVYVEQGEGLPDEHLADRELPSTEAFAGR